MGRPSKRVRKVRRATEFDLLRLSTPPRAPTTPQSVYAWSLESIRAARDAQLLGIFEQPVRLAAAMRTDSALAVPYWNRLAPQGSVGVAIKPPNESAPALRVAGEAEGLFGAQGVGVRSETLADMIGTLANHGLAIGYNIPTPREDGSRIDFEMRAWPLEWVRWNPTERTLMTRTHNGPEIPITHGDGRWVIAAKHELEPWTQEACVLSGALVWATHAYGMRDWGKGSKAHGNAKLIGELPEGVALQDKDGALTPEAQAFIDLMQAIMVDDALAGIRPAGSKTDFVVDTSTAWQVFDALVQNADKAAARIYLGTDAMLGSVGGAPGVDIATLFGVASTKVQSDLACIERALLTGVIEPWAAMNFGDSTLAPRRVYLLPDPDEERVRSAFAERMTQFQDTVRKHRENGFTVDQALVDRLAKEYGVPAPLLPEKKTDAPSITVAPTDLARVVTVNEARASANLGALMLPTGGTDPDGLLTVEQFAAKKAAQVAPPSTPLAPTNGQAPRPTPTA